MPISAPINMPWGPKKTNPPTEQETVDPIIALTGLFLINAASKRPRKDTMKKTVMLPTINTTSFRNVSNSILLLVLVLPEYVR